MTMRKLTNEDLLAVKEARSEPGILVNAEAELSAD
jgi:hypothetical protein